MAENDGDKSQDPTPHRRQQARDEGRVAKSQDFSSAALLLASLATLLMLGGGLVEMLGRYFIRQLSGSPWMSVDSQFVVLQWHETVAMLAKYLLPIFGFVMISGIAVNFVQTGFLFVPQKLMPDLSRLDPLRGFARIFSFSSGARLFFGLVKMLVIAGVAYTCLYNQRATIMGLTDLSVPQIAAYLAQILLWTGIKIAVALLFLSVLDYGVQRWRHERDLRMTPQELREEMRNLEGNPQMTARRKLLRGQMAANRLSDAVPKADMILISQIGPTGIAGNAIAIQYDSATMESPVVVAKGIGPIAEQIRKLAAAGRIPILEKPLLTQTLYNEVAASQPIPRDHFAAVAEALASIYRSQGKTFPE